MTLPLTDSDSRRTCFCFAGSRVEATRPFSSYLSLSVTLEVDVHTSQTTMTKTETKTQKKTLAIQHYLLPHVLTMFVD